jgi:hypothetical protein
LLLKKPKTDYTFFKNAWILIKKKKVLIGTGLFIVYSVLVLGLGYVLQRHDFYGLFLKPVLAKNYRMVESYLKSLSINPEKIVINIKHKEYLKLAFKRQEALKTHRLHYSPEDWVPATVEYRGETHKVNIRLKGMGEEHWKHEYAWSFKIKVKGDNTLFGMKRFALQAAKTRLYMNEWYWHKLLKYTGLIHLRYEFVDVTVNGRQLPVYAIEENFEKRLIENNQRREGPVFMAYLVSFLNPGKLKPLNRAINIYQSAKYSRNLEFMKLVHVAESRIEAYRQGKLPFSKVFDVDKMGKLFALSDLVETRHGLYPKNLRYYFNPVTSLIEPIAYDMNIYESRIPQFNFMGAGQRFVDHENQDSDWTWPLVAFRDRLLFKKYIESLEEISDKNFLDQFFIETQKEGQEKISILHKSFPYYEFKKKEVFYKNLKYIRKQLQPKKSLNIYFDGVSKEERVLYLDIANIHSFPVEVLGASIDGKILKPLKETIVQAFNNKGIFHDTTPLSPEINNMTEAVLKEVKGLVNRLPMVSLKKTKTDQKPKSKKMYGLEHEIVKFQIPEGFLWSDNLVPRIRVTSRVFGANFETSDEIIPWAQHEDLFMQPANIKEITFMSTEEEKKIIRIHQGAWTVDQDIIVPAGYRVTTEQGTHLNLINGAKILSYSPLEFIGSKERPIIISSDGKSGQGIVVMQAKDKSIMQYVVFDGLSNPKKGGWALTGAVTFYESPVLLSNVEFINNQSEDALNIIRSEFTLTDAVFRNIFSDALDSDFSNGVIKNISFSNCGNDGLDASGSKINVKNIFLDGIGDKGISAGEKSYISIDALNGINSKIIVASKDQSEVVIQKAQVGHSQIGFTAFQKKSEFGPGTIKIKVLEMKNLETPFLVEEESVIEVDGVPIKTHKRDIGKLLYGG